jgi:hypothetical protein
VGSIPTSSAPLDPTWEALDTKGAETSRRISNLLVPNLGTFPTYRYLMTGTPPPKESDHDRQTRTAAGVPGRTLQDRHPDQCHWQVDPHETRRLVQEVRRVEGDAPGVGGHPCRARASAGVLSTEINHAVGEDAVLVHHVFEDAEALIDYFSTTANRHMGALTKVAKAELHLVRGVSIPAPAREALLARNVPVVFGEWLFGYVKGDYQRPDPETAI